MTPVEVQGGDDAGEVCYQEILLKSQRFSVYTGGGGHTMETGGGWNEERECWEIEGLGLKEESEEEEEWKR